MTTTDGTSTPIVWVAGTQGDGKLYGFRGTDGALLAAAGGGRAAISDSGPLCGPTAAFMWPPTARSTPSCIRASRGGPAGRTRVHNADEIMAEIVAKRLVEHLERSGFVVMKRPPMSGGDALGRGFEG